MGAETTEAERWTDHSLIWLRHKRIEELEKKLKSMEDLMRRPVSNPQPGLNGVDFRNDSGRLQTPPTPIQSEAGASDPSSNLNRAFTTVREEFQASDLALSLSDGKCESAVHLPELMIASGLHCSR